MPRMNAPDATYPTMKHNFKWGKILDLDGGEDTAKIEIVDKDGNGTGEIMEDVPIFYHCDPDVEEKDNGALEGASSAFSIDDEVFIKFEGDSPVIIGRKDGLKSCVKNLFVFCFQDNQYIFDPEGFKFENMDNYQPFPDETYISPHAHDPNYAMQAFYTASGPDKDHPELIWAVKKEQGGGIDYGDDIGKGMLILNKGKNPQILYDFYPFRNFMYDYYYRDRYYSKIEKEEENIYKITQAEAIYNYTNCNIIEKRYIFDPQKKTFEIISSNILVSTCDNWDDNLRVYLFEPVPPDIESISGSPCFFNPYIGEWELGGGGLADETSINISDPPYCTEETLFSGIERIWSDSINIIKAQGSTINKSGHCKGEGCEVCFPSGWECEYFDAQYAYNKDSEYTENLFPLPFFSESGDQMTRSWACNPDTGGGQPGEPHCCTSGGQGDPPIGNGSSAEEGHQKILGFSINISEFDIVRDYLIVAGPSGPEETEGAGTKTEIDCLKASVGRAGKYVLIGLLKQSIDPLQDPFFEFYLKIDDGGWEDITTDILTQFISDTGQQMSLENFMAVFTYCSKPL